MTYNTNFVRVMKLLKDKIYISKGFERKRT